MPLYTYVCEKHGEFDYFRTVRDRDFAPCPVCKVMCPKKLIQDSKIVLFEPYWDENLGKGKPVYVRSKRHKKQLMKKAGLVEVGAYD